MFGSLLFLLAFQNSSADEFEPPLVGRPDHFTGAVGAAFDVAMRASPSEAALGKPFVLTVRVTARGPWLRPPLRPHLAGTDSFTERFQIVRSASDLPDRSIPDRRFRWSIDRGYRPGRSSCLNTAPAVQQSWEFDYEIRPIDEEVDLIPPLPFDYYRPSQRRYARTYSDELPIKVLPASTADTKPIPVEAPESFFRQAEEYELLQGGGMGQIPGTGLILVLLFIPPVACVGWYIAWKRLYPDAQKLARRRQSRAAKQALSSLGQLSPSKPSEQARQVSRIATQYMWMRLGMGSLEPTPGEVKAWLEQSGVPAHLCTKGSELFRTCDTIRFAPLADKNHTNLTAAAREFIVAVESES